MDRQSYGVKREENEKITIAPIPISPFEGFGIKNEAKEASREAIHEAIDGWIDEVIEMKKGAGLGGITEEIFKKRQKMMGKSWNRSSWSYSLTS